MEKERVLIVDDSRMNHKMLSELLEKEYKIESVYNGQEAIQFLEKEKDIAVMILDINMPVLDGFHVLEQMRLMGLEKRIPVVVNTQYGEENNELKALQLGASDFITKSYNPQIVVHRIHNVIAKRHYEIDQLTGARSREAFYIDTDHAINKSNEDFVLVYWNIERFKLINDIFGNNMGNAILKAMAEMISTDKKNLVTFGRTYGDHFVACYKKDNFNPEELVTNSQKFFKNLIKNYSISFSMGIYEIDDKQLPIDQMCDRAALAMERIKGQYFVHYAYYNEEMRESLLSMQEIAGYAGRAMKNHQFYIQIQPIYSAESEVPVSGEALVRWRHPKRGIIPPNEFIPIFEENGYISKLDAFVREEVCIYLRKSLDEGKKIVPISINLSRMELLDEHLADELERLAKKYGIDKKYLHFEVTESAYAENPQQLTKTVSKIKEKGFQVLMDDFGSGYSSLNMLKNVDVDVLKIDMEFLRDLDVCKKGGNVLASIIRMAKCLDMTVIAEGIERREQVAFLASVGCNAIQGYYFSRPLDVNDFMKVLEKHDIKDKESDILEPQNLDDVDFNDLFNIPGPIRGILDELIGGVGIYEVSENSIMALRVNHGYYELFGENMKQLFDEQANVLENLSKEEGVLLMDACKQAIKEHKFGRLILHRRRFDGSFVEVEAKLCYIGTKDKKNIFYILYNEVI